MPRWAASSAFSPAARIWIPRGESRRKAKSARKRAAATPTVSRSNVETTAPPGSLRGGLARPSSGSGWRMRSVYTSTIAARSRMPSVTATTTVVARTCVTASLDLEPRPAADRRDAVLGRVPAVDLVVRVLAIVIVRGPLDGATTEPLRIDAHPGHRRRELVLGARPAALLQRGLEHHRGDPTLCHVVSRVRRLALDEVDDLRVDRQALHEERVATEGMQGGRLQARQLVLGLLVAVQQVLPRPADALERLEDAHLDVPERPRQHPVGAGVLQLLRERREVWRVTRHDHDGDGLEPEVLRELLRELQF